MTRLLASVTRLPGLRLSVAGFAVLLIFGWASAASLGTASPARLLGFAEAPVRLTIDFTGSGTGSVEADPPGGDCTTDCSLPYSPGKVVVLTATAGTGSTFGSWTGCDSTSGTGGSVCLLTVGTSRTATVAFTSP